MDRRQLLRYIGLGSMAGIAGCLSNNNGSNNESAPQNETSGPEPAPENVIDYDEYEPVPELEDENIPDAVTVSSISSEPLGAITDVIWHPTRSIMYAASQSGVIFLIENESLTNGELAVDLKDRVWSGRNSPGGGLGLLGLEFHPDFPDSRRVFVRYEAKLTDQEEQELPDGYTHKSILSEFLVRDDNMRIDPSSEKRLLEVNQPSVFHNAGSLRFGPDGHLYVPIANGGTPNEVGELSAEDWYNGHHNLGGNSQDTTQNLLGSLIRISVTDERGEYTVPDSNPLTDLPNHLDEQYAWGLRNPWRISFDGDDLYIADAGEANWEQVYFGEKGANYGHNVRQGKHCIDFNTGNNQIPTNCPDRTPSWVRHGTEEFKDPVVEYLNVRNDLFDPEKYPSGYASLGGNVYRGDSIPGLQGMFVSADSGTNSELFVAKPGEPHQQWPMTTMTLRSNGSSPKLNVPFGIRRSPDGELYVHGSSGIFKLTPV